MTAPSRAPGGRGIRWPISLLLLGLHVGAVAAPFFFSWRAVLVGIVMYWVAGGIGVGLGYHRLLTHRAFAIPKPLEYAFALCGSLGLQGGPGWWVATHREHHAHADREGDPHSPHDGAWWSHVGWVLRGYTLRHDRSVEDRYAPELVADTFHRLLTRFHLLPPAVVGVALFALGGWPFLLWGLCASGTALLHSTWLVNSAAHLWGRRRFATRDDSRNCWWVALLTFGEGWHNNHHASPRSARHGIAWYEFDVNWVCIRALELVGVATSVRGPVGLAAGRRLAAPRPE